MASVDFDVRRYSRGWGGGIAVLRTAILDCWVSDFLAEHSGGTVVELGTGLNDRFDRVGSNGEAHWIDLDLPDTIERYVLPLASRIVGDVATVTLFRTRSR